MRRAAAIICLWAILLSPGCSTYTPTVTPFKLPEAYANVQRVADTYVGARVWADDAEARAAFGQSEVAQGAPQRDQGFVRIERRRREAEVVAHDSQRLRRL